MRKRNLFIGVVAGALLLSGCGFLNHNDEKEQQLDSQSTNKKTSNSSSKESGANNNQAQQNEKKEGKIYPKNTTKYYAQMILTNDNELPKAEVRYTPIDVSGQPINPHNPDASARYPDGVIKIHSSATAYVFFKDNNDGTVTFYEDSQSIFPYPGVQDSDFSKRETQRILTSARTVPINRNLTESNIDYVASLLTNDTPQKDEGPFHFETDPSSSDDTSSTSP